LSGSQSVKPPALPVVTDFRRLIRSNIIPVTAAGKKENRIVR
jgi:hypothetical protein